MPDTHDLIAQLQSPLQGHAVHPDTGIGLATSKHHWSITTTDPLAVLAELNTESSPRWAPWARGSSPVRCTCSGRG